MAVITISREFGSSGVEIAEKAAATLGYPLADKQTIGALLSQYGLIEFNRVYESVPDFWERFGTQTGEERQIVIDMMNRVLRALARRGNIVILGRGSYVVLAGLADVLHVRVQAPFESRVTQVMQWQHLNDRAQAEVMVRDNDKFRAQFIKSVYGEHSENLKSFDIVVNTEKVTIEMAASWTVAVARALPRKDLEQATGEEPSQLRYAADLPEDSILAEAVEQVLKADK